MTTDSIAGYFEDDHARLDRRFKEFQDTKRTDFARAAAHFAEFKAGLERHIVWEEEILFPGFEDKTGMHHSGPTEVMRMEHRLIKQFLQAIAQKLARQDTDTEAEESGLRQTLGEHNRKEEQILYPAIDGMLNPAERARAFARMGVAPTGSHAGEVAG
jgi:iron-sulfur cluster repair protein YtfE (RIC family)